MELLDIFLIVATTTLVILLCFLIGLMVVIFRTIRHLKNLESTLQSKVASFEQEWSSKKSKAWGAFPFVTSAAPIIFTLWKTFRARRK